MISAKETSEPEEIRVRWLDRKAVAVDTGILPRSLLQNLSVHSCQECWLGVAHSSAPSQSMSLAKGSHLTQDSVPILRDTPTPQLPRESIPFSEEVLFPKHCPINNLHSKLHLFPRGPGLRHLPTWNRESWYTGQGSWKCSRLKGRIFVSWLRKRNSIPESIILHRENKCLLWWTDNKAHKSNHVHTSDDMLRHLDIPRVIMMMVRLGRCRVYKLTQLSREAVKVLGRRWLFKHQK